MAGGIGGGRPGWNKDSPVPEFLGQRDSLAPPVRCREHQTDTSAPQESSRDEGISPCTLKLSTSPLASCFEQKVMPSSSAGFTPRGKKDKFLTVVCNLAS